MLNFDDADAGVEVVDDAVTYPHPNIDDDDTKSFSDENSNVEGIEGAILRPPTVEDCWVDLAVGVNVCPPAAVDHWLDVGDRRPPFDLYAFGEQGNFSNIIVPLPDGWIGMIRAQDYPEVHGYYSAETDDDHYQY